MYHVCNGLQVQSIQPQLNFMQRQVSKDLGVVLANQARVYNMPDAGSVPEATVEMLQQGGQINNKLLYPVVNLR